MIIPDVNLLLYAVVTAFPQHETAHTWWEETINSASEIGLASPAIFGFIRIATNPRVLSPPLPVAAATGFISGWRGQPNISHLIPGPRHIEIASGLLAGVGTGGNLTTDVQLAADGAIVTVVGGTTPADHDGWMWDLTVPGNNDHDFYVLTTSTVITSTKLRPGAWPSSSTIAAHSAKRRRSKRRTMPVRPIR